MSLASIDPACIADGRYAISFLMVKSMRNTSLLMTALLFATGCVAESLEVGSEGAGAGTATEESAALSAADRGTERHCLVHAEPGDRGRAKLGAMTCYASIAEVIRTATDGRVALPPATRARDVNEALLAEAGYDASAPSLASILLGIDYSEPSYGGSTLTITAPYGCYDPATGLGYTWYVDTLPAGWDNVASSAQTFSYCRSTTIFDGAFQTGAGATLGCDAPTFGALDNRVSSQQFSLFGSCPWF